MDHGVIVNPDKNLSFGDGVSMVHVVCIFIYLHELVSAVAVSLAVSVLQYCNT